MRKRSLKQVPVANVPADVNPRTLLTYRQEAFCVAIVEGKKPVEAYIEAYGAEHLKVHNVATHASKLIRNPKIIARVQQLRDMVAKPKITLDKHLDDLLALRNRAAQLGQLGPAIAAEVARGKAAGVTAPEKSEVDLRASATQPMPSSVDEFL